MKRFAPIFAFLTLTTCFCAPVVVLAVESGFVPLSPNLPIIGRKFDVDTLPELFNIFLTVAVVIAAILAIVMVAIGGVKYMTTDSVFAMGDAKEQITNAIVGLLVVLTAVLILATINPELVKLRIFNSSYYSPTK
ncbi:MAG: hypothetical protein KBD24_01675 [Candidatus Pacebacteria bacterium]|nr:hypothetical protein [Candidatus Paceibacterota bacterium]